MKSAYNTCNLCRIITEIYSNVKCHQARDKSKKQTNKNYIGKQKNDSYSPCGLVLSRQTLETSEKITIMTWGYTNSQLYGMTM